MMALAAQSADMLISNEDIEAAFVLYSLMTAVSALALDPKAR